MDTRSKSYIALKELVQKIGLKRWALVAKEICAMFGLHITGKQCRERWHNHVDPA